MTRKFIPLFILVVLWFAAATPLLSKKIAELPDVFNPNYFHILDKNIYIMDDYFIKVYSLPDLEPVKKFLGKGEGPGQVTLNPSLSIVNNKIVVNSALKLVIFSPMGDLISEKKIKYGKDYISPVDNHFVGSQFVLDFKKRFEERGAFLFRKRETLMFYL